MGVYSERKPTIESIGLISLKNAWLYGAMTRINDSAFQNSGYSQKKKNRATIFKIAPKI
jgi:hypothetical protein